MASHPFRARVLRACAAVALVSSSLLPGVGAGVASGQTDALYVDATANVGVGTSAPTAKLHVAGVAPSTIGLQVDNADGSSTQIPSTSGHVYLTAPDNKRLYARNYDPATSTYTYLAMFRTDASYAAKIYGNLLVDSTTYTSSGRWKKNVRTLENALDKLARLRGVAFEWKDEAQNDLGYKPKGGRQVGFIAEEVAQVLPDVVMKSPDGATVDGVDYGKLVPLLVEAVKEQQAQIAALQARVQTLENAKQP